jgi:hypothetical protein
MRRGSKIAAGLLTVAVGIPLLIIGAINANAWYYRWRAEHLLTVLKTVRPGVTTATEYLQLIQPFETCSGEIRIDDKLVPGALAIGNRSSWIEDILMAGNSFLDDLLAYRVIPPDADFAVVPTYAGGVVSQIELHAFSGVSGHPPGARVSWSASKYERDNAGYEEFRQGYYVSQEGLSGRAPWIFFISMDERATSDERSRALNLQFQCFTRFSGCQDAGMYVQPAPNR